MVIFMLVQNKDNQKGWHLVRSVSPNSLLTTFFYRTAIIVILSNPKNHYSQLVAHRCSRCRSPSFRRHYRSSIWFLGLKNPRLFALRASRRSEATPSGRGTIMKMRLEDRIFDISMRRGNVGASACSVRGFHSRNSRQSRKGLEQYFVIRSIGYAIRWSWGRDLQSPSTLSAHRPLYSETANNIFAVTERHFFSFDSSVLLYNKFSTHWITELCI